MKSAFVCLFLATAVSVVAAKPHRHHHHQHLAKRDVVVVTVPGPTVIEYRINDTPISEADVCKGIKDESIYWPAGTENPPSCNPNKKPDDAPPSSSSSTSPTAAPSAAGNAFFQKNAADKPSTSVASSTTPAAAKTPEASSASPPQSSSGTSSPQTASGGDINTEFPDGKVKCSEFPSKYGAIPITWEGLDGWSGIQYVTFSNGAGSNIVTAVPGGTQPCKADGDRPAMCSYACPPGYQKSQWPDEQGSTNESIGGLKCKPDGFLYLNPNREKKLCIPGTGNVQVQNTMSSNVPICRTDYPGTEGETVPVDVTPGSTKPLTCPNASTYYKWIGKSTTAEYYVNFAGIPVDQGCTWSKDDGGHKGNWAPVVFGVGTDTAGLTWLSIQTTRQNDPVAGYKDLDYTVELVGDFGGSSCYYVFKDNAGRYCSKGKPSEYESNKASCVTYDKIKTPVPGCTVQLMSGTATYRLG